MNSSIFLNNKYTTTYFSIINRAISRVKSNEEYYENHHIIPKCLGGEDNTANLVFLTAKEHFIVHHLLTKMTEDTLSKGKLWSAFFLMHIGHSNRLTFARTYELAKKQMALHKKEIYKEEKNPFFGKTHTESTKKKMSNNWNRSAKRNQDIKLYTFTHEKLGTHKCTRYELCQSFNLNHKDVYKIVHRVQKSTKGWSIVWESEVTF